MLPLVSEQQVSRFKFWFQEAMHEGMHYQSELFHCLYTCPASKLSSIYSLCSALADQGVRTVVTCASNSTVSSPEPELQGEISYTLWASLRKTRNAQDAAAEVEQQSSSTFDMAITDFT